MSVEKIKNLRESPEIKLNEGMDELSAVTDVAFTKALEMSNWRVSDDGERCEKRDGVTGISGTPGAGGRIGSEDGYSWTDVYCYHTYYNEDGTFCQLAITEDKVWRKVGSGDFTSIHSWASNLTHPVKVLDVQGKQIIITEIENIMILPDGTKVQVGITAPTTAPTITAEFLDLDLDEDCAGIADWTDDDAGSGASTQATYDSKSCFKFLTTGASGDIAKRRRDLTTISPDYTFEVKIYFDEMGTVADSDHFELNIYNGRIQLKVRVSSQQMSIYDGTNWKVILKRRMERRRRCETIRSRRSQDEIVEIEQCEWYWEENIAGACPITIKDTWHTLKLAVKSSDPENETVEAFVDDISMGEHSCANKDTSNPGRIELVLNGSTVASIAYTDWIKLKNGDIKTGNLKGVYRYAFTYARSGNYPNESNPIKSTVGTATQTGSGLDDLTPGGTYTGSEDMTIRVQIDSSVASPDTMKWSDDGGETWISTSIPLATTIYLPFGIELTWGAVNGHTLNDYWEFACNALSTTPSDQKVDITSIPTSSDAQVDQRKVYRTLKGGSTYYLVAVINDNTTTTFTDNLPDALLGSSMAEDNDIAPLGKYAEWWDGRLWIADDDDNIVYYSKTLVPDSFDTSNHYVSARRGISNDKIMNMIEYRGLFYIFKRHAISYVRKRLDGTYGAYHGPKTNGNIAPWSLLEAHGLLMYLSFKGWEVFNGEETFTTKFSKAVRTTLQSVDKTNADKVMAAQLYSRDEVWLSIPDRTGSLSAITVICNFLKSAFYTFSFSKTPSCLCEARDSSKEIQLYMGTRDAYVGTCESGTQDFGTNITAAIRTGWWKFPKYQNFPMTEIEYEAPTGKTLTINHYVNFDKDVKRTKSLSGATPSSTDQSIRLPIKNQIEKAIRGKYLATEFTNAEDVGSDIKLNWFKEFYAPMARKGEIKGD